MQTKLLLTEMIRTARFGECTVEMGEVVEARVGEFGSTKAVVVGRMMGLQSAQLRIVGEE